MSSVAPVFSPVRSTLLALLFLTWIGEASANVISPVAATSDSGRARGWGTLDRTIDGTGLNGPPSPTTTHNRSATGNAWLADFRALTPEITFDLGGVFDVDGVLFWNIDSSEEQSGIRDLTILSSTDGVNFNAIPGAPTTFQRGLATAQQSTFSGVNATHIRFDVQNNHGSVNFTGFAEVAFTGQSVPEPTSAFSFLGLGLTVAVCRRRRRHSKE